MQIATSGATQCSVWISRTLQRDRIMSALAPKRTFDLRLGDSTG